MHTANMMVPEREVPESDQMGILLLVLVQETTHRCTRQSIGKNAMQGGYCVEQQQQQLCIA